MSFGINRGLIENTIIELFNKLSQVGELPELIELYANSGEISKEKFTQGVKDAMADYLISMGLDLDNLDKNKFNLGGYDELFAMAYQHAREVADGKDDPLDGTRTRNGNSSQWDFTVDTFDQLGSQGFIKENIACAGGADYIYELGERLGIFRLADALVLNWSSGAIDVVDGAAASKLYRYWKLRDDRSTPEERSMLYTRVLAKGNGQLLDRMVANEHFPALWQMLMEEVANYINKSESLEGGTTETSPVSRSRIYQATKELQYNLTEYCTGMAHMQTREIYAQLQEALDILREPEILAHFGGSRRKTVWSVIEELSKSEFGTSPNIGAHRTLAIAGNKVFQWIANFDDATTRHEEFVEFLEAAESYILNMSVVENTSHYGEEAVTDGGLNDEFDDEFGDDF